MGSALGGRDGVHLVDDHRLDAREELPRARREHQVQALGRRDEDVGRRTQHAPALVRRRVARAHGDAGSGEVDARGGRRRPDAREGRAQVALDVVVERLEGRDVEHAQALAGLREHAVEEPQERSQGLAGARRRAHEHVLARRDRRPAQGLSGRGRAERALEPAACVGREAGECVSGDGGHRRCTIREVRASRLPQQDVEREQPAGGHDHRRRKRDASRHGGLLRPAPADRARTAARTAHWRPARARRGSRKGRGRWPRRTAARQPRRRCRARCAPAAQARRARAQRARP